MLINWHKSCVAHPYISRERHPLNGLPHNLALHHKSTDIFLEQTFHMCKSHYYQKGLQISLHGHVK